MRGEAKKGGNYLENERGGGECHRRGTEATEAQKRKKSLEGPSDMDTLVLICCIGTGVHSWSL